jgi:hypothetical protein
MRFAVIGALVAACIVAGAVVIVVALTGEDDGERVLIPVPSVLAEVCSQTEATLSPDVVELTAPLPAASITSPLHVAGSIDRIADNGETFNTIFVALVIPDGTHIIDYPLNLSQEEERVSFDREIPFTYFESTPACLWLYQESLDRPEALRIPVAIEPLATATPGG